MPLIINQQNLVANYQFFTQQANVAPVVKANAYGTGIENTAPVLHKADAQQFFVAYPQEGVKLRQLLPTIQIFVLNGFTASNLDIFKKYNLTPVCNTPTQIQLLPANMFFALQIETGMNRSGANLPEIKRQPDLLMSHLACAEDASHPLNQQQLERFQQAITKYNPKQTSLAASYGCLLGTDYHFDFCRVGIGLYGGIGHPAIKPVVEWSVDILETRLVKAGESVGYDSTWVAQQDSIIATLNAGYADGYPRALSNKGVALINNTPCPVVGRVSMDLITVDVTHLPQSIDEHALLYGPHYTVNQAATDTQTNSYEILTNLNNIRN